jgi:DNA-binding transcriptional LysR family regulator
MLLPLDLELLRTFVAVAESGSFSNAAPLVGRSQSAVSMPMQRLEQSLAPLLVRGPQAARPNAAGEALLPFARRLLRLSAEAQAAVTQSAEAGTVRLGAPEDYAAYFLPPVLARFATEHPLVSIDLVCEPSRSLSAAINSGRIDLALVTCLASDDPEILRREPIVWVASADKAAWTNEPLPVALFGVGCGPAHAHAVEALKASGRQYRVAYPSASLAGLVGVVEAGLAIAAVPRCSIPPSLWILGEADGLPPIQDLGMTVLHSPDATSTAVVGLQNFNQQALSHESYRPYENSG